MNQVIKKAAADKPAKPYPDFPLFPHATKRWAKKIRGKLYYFGLWSDPDGAIEKYQRQREDLYAGRAPREEVDGVTIRELANRFLTVKRHLVSTGEITQRTFNDYHTVCERLVNAFGKSRLVADLSATDFQQYRAVIAKGWGPVTLGNEIQRVRVVFKYAYDACLIDRPVRFGPSFKRPSKSVLRKARAEKGTRMFEAAEIRSMLEIAPLHLKAMILLGINCGFGNSDVANLPRTALDLKKAWVDYPRPKTGVARRCPLWPETVRAIQAASAKRPTPKSPAHVGLVFVTKYGQRWTKDTSSDSPISNELRKLLKALGINRHGLNFYALRHGFETIGGETRDQVAVDSIMGHVDSTMAGVYRERISDERLKAVTDHVHAWLFPNEKKASAKQKKVTTASKASTNEGKKTASRRKPR